MFCPININCMILFCRPVPSSKFGLQSIYLHLLFRILSHFFHFALQKKTFFFPFYNTKQALQSIYPGSLRNSFPLISTCPLFFANDFISLKSKGNIPKIKHVNFVASDTKPSDRPSPFVSNFAEKNLI